jgi:hypothetical protein
MTRYVEGEDEGAPEVSASELRARGGYGSGESPFKRPSRRPVLHRFLEGEMLPQAARAADLGLDPTPFFTVISDVVRLYAEALEPPDAGFAERISRHRGAGRLSAVPRP